MGQHALGKQGNATRLLAQRQSMEKGRDSRKGDRGSTGGTRLQPRLTAAAPMQRVTAGAAAVRNALLVADLARCVRARRTSGSLRSARRFIT